LVAAEINASVSQADRDIDHVTLLKCLADYCTCQIEKVCAGHEALRSEPKFEARLGFGRWAAPRLLHEEFNVGPLTADIVLTEPEPYLTSEYAWRIIRGMEDAA
jgi:hypothetical protein